MANIQRNIKTFGTRTFAAEVAAAPGNKVPILSAEVDADFDTVFQAWNGGVGLGDIADGSVGTNQIANGAVTNAKLGADAVTSDKIKDGEVKEADLATDAVTTVKIKDLNVTKAKLEIGASLWSVGAQNRSRDNINIGAGGATATSYLSLPNIKARAVPFTSFITTRIYLMGTAIVPDAAGLDIHARLMRDGSVVVDDFYGWCQSDGSQEAPWTIFWESLVATPDVNNHNYTVDVLTIGPGHLGSLRAGNITMIAYT